jgi:hypothetical protein
MCFYLNGIPGVMTFVFGQTIEAPAYPSGTRTALLKDNYPFSVCHCNRFGGELCNSTKVLLSGPICLCTALLQRRH